MNDRTIPRAVRQGARTQPVESKPRPQPVRGNPTLTPDELAIALEMARTERIDRDVAAYAIRKRNQ